MSLALKILNRARVLIIDDELTNVRPLEGLLQKVGKVEAKSTTDPREAVKLYKEFRPDIILLDLGMPHMDGFEVMKELEKVIPEDTYLPILILTADITSETKRRALAAGAKDFVTKPIDSTEVLLRITNLLETRFLHLQLQSQNVLLEEHVNERTAQLKETLLKLRTTQKQAIRRERLGALGVMASGIAHDFNNALTMILGYAELLKENPGHAQYLQTIIGAAQDATLTVRRLKDFYRQDSSEELHVPVLLNSLVDQAVSLTLPRWSTQALNKGVEIQVTTDLRDLPSIDGSAAELREMLTNLIFNAVDALPKGGWINIKTRIEQGAVVLEFSDNGLGMDEKVKQSCFEPFFTTKGEMGSGLGLSVVYGIVKRHRGSIDLQSEPGKGTTLFVRFPYSSSAAETGNLDFQLERSLQILLVDYQQSISKVIAELLVGDGHVVDVAETSEATLSCCRERKYDLVILDRAMPEVGGEELVTSVKKINPDMPVILLAGLDGTSDLQVVPPGIDLIINKPITISDLRGAIHKVIKSPRVAA